jgi:glyoxylase-like metal-dependent hydrolase (beta-lactamase superfamily II)
VPHYDGGINMQIIPNVYLVQGAVSNCYLLVDDDGLTLIDTGLARDKQKILTTIADLGRAARDLRRILITHADGDHMGGLAALQAASGARVYASAIEARAIAAGESSRPLKPQGWQAIVFALMRPLMGRMFKAAPATVDEIVNDGQVLPVLGGLRVVSTVGHTPGHISLFAPTAGILFVGDSLVAEGDTLRGSRGMNTWDQAKANESVKLQAALGARIVCSGHGPVMMDAVNKFPALL